MAITHVGMAFTAQYNGKKTLLRARLDVIDGVSGSEMSNILPAVITDKPQSRYDPIPTCLNETTPGDSMTLPPSSMKAISGPMLRIARTEAKY